MIFFDKPSNAYPSARPPSALERVSGAGPLVQFLCLGGLALPAVAALIWATTGGHSGVATGLGVTVFLIAVSLAAFDLRRSFPHAVLGWCNAVTLFRAGLVSGLVAMLAVPSPEPWTVIAIATLAFTLDGLDGWLARREGLSSPFGARFDVEVDSALALFLTLHAWLWGGVGAWVLLFGLPRYAFAAAQWVYPWLDGPLPERFTRKLVCVAQIAVLIAILLPFVGPAAANALLGLIAAALIWSFTLDIRHLRRSRG
ncbi:MAG: CDP-alcohol phosphatidyltransferase family protein [Pseudomonadota bacterium]